LLGTKKKKKKLKAGLYSGIVVTPVLIAEFLLFCFVDDQMGTRPASPLLLVEGHSSKQLSLCCCLNLDNTAGTVRNKRRFIYREYPTTKSWTGISCTREITDKSYKYTS